MPATVLLVAGTHGNERNAPWLLEQWQRQSAMLARPGLRVISEIGNPDALAAGRRYIDRDLNRSFQSQLLNNPSCSDREVIRARSLLEGHGPQASDPAQVLIDLHSTTAAMGSCLVVYGERPADLALASACQFRLGLPIYLHGFDPKQSGFMAEAWPCGVVLEVGPVPQGVLCPRICQQTQLGVETLLDLLAEARQKALKLPASLVIHRHLGSYDLPRTQLGSPQASLHPERLRGDWRALRPGDPLFLTGDGEVIPFQSEEKGSLHSVFSNEAAYQEKGIALSLARRECLAVDPSWADALTALLAR